MSITLTRLRNNVLSHYANMSVKYTANFNGCKNDNLQYNYLDFFFFLLET